MHQHARRRVLGQLGLNHEVQPKHRLSLCKLVNASQWLNSIVLSACLQMISDNFAVGDAWFPNQVSHSEAAPHRAVARLDEKHKHETSTIK